MGAVERISVELSEELAALVRDQVAAGRYASADEMVGAALEALREDDVPDPALDAWIVREVLPAIDAYRADPSTAITLDEACRFLGLPRDGRDDAAA